jgi:hypothetical protein
LAPSFVVNIRCKPRQPWYHVPAKTAVGIEEDQQHRLPAKMRERFAFALQVHQLEQWRFAPYRQTLWVIGVAELQFVQPFFRFIKTMQDTTTLPELLPPEPAACKDRKPRKRHG